MINITAMALIIAVIIIAFLIIYLQMNNIIKLLREFLTTKYDLNEPLKVRLQDESERLSDRDKLLETLISTALISPYLEQAVNGITEAVGNHFNAEQKALESILARKLGTSLDDLSEYLNYIYNTNNDLLGISSCLKYGFWRFSWTLLFLPFSLIVPKLFHINVFGKVKIL